MLNFLSYWILISLIGINYTYITDYMMLPVNSDTTAWGRDCPGNDLYHFDSLPIDCEQHCSRTEGCTHFVWNTTNDGTCWLKKGAISLNDSIQSHHPETMCSINRLQLYQNATIRKINGNTTYKWECNSPKCSYNARILRSNKRVKDCLQNGYSASEVTMISMSHDWKVATGDPSFICNDQQPWSINDQLAYGYAFIHGQQIRDLDYCCICYQLNFTNSLIQGKNMIVQIIDYQTEFIGETTMKLLIPGTGDNFYKCEKQWVDRYAPEFVYDPNYKYPSKILSREQCYQLPKPLQNGCLFRFDWFKNVQNPQTIYRKVQCPKELVERSGCQQGIINN